MDAYAALPTSLPLEGTTVNLSVRWRRGSRLRPRAQRPSGSAPESRSSWRRGPGRAPELRSRQKSADVRTFWCSTTKFPSGPTTARSDVARFIDPEILRSDFGDYLLGFGTPDSVGSVAADDGSIRAIPLTSIQKASCSTRSRSSSRPNTRYPLHGTTSSRLSDQIVADGGTPWCFGFESGPGKRLARHRPSRESGTPSRRRRDLRRMDTWRDRVHQSSGEGGRQARQRPDLRTRLRERRYDEHQPRGLSGPTQPHARSRQCDR